MSYAKMMKWQRTHRKGTRQPVLMSTGSGFWPSWSWTQNTHRPYIEACEALGVEPFAGEVFYRASCMGRIMSGQTPEAQAAYTKARREAGKSSPFD